ncbi:MAG: endo-1,4-beta-xylanase [Nitrospirae bacterium]|nr:endo-1,4-beta-xylanase [Nitrospirota bacterium]
MALMKAPNSQLSLRTIARARDLQIGTAVAAKPMMNDALYNVTLAREFGILTPKDAMKFGAVHQCRYHYDFSEADAIVAPAEANGSQVRGHTLVWEPVSSISEQLPFDRLPFWLTAQGWKRDELISVLREHIRTVVGRYRGRIAAWDVVNEAIDEDGSLKKNIWMRHIGPGYIELAFRWAHEADPDAKLFYNDYNAEGQGGKSDAVYALVRDLVRRGVPIHGVGMQLHVSLDSYPDPGAVAVNIRRLSALGLEVHITEMDVRIDGLPTEEKLSRQAGIYRGMLAACLSAPGCKAFVIWGFTDRYSWIPEYFSGADSALIFDRSYRPKLAYKSLKDELSTSDARKTPEKVPCELCGRK